MDISNGRYWDKPWSLVDGCTPCSPGCEHCWSMAMGKRFHKWPEKVTIRPDRLDIPLRTRKPTVFSLWNDLFHEDVPDEFIDRVFDQIWLASQHTFLILTKRPERLVAYIQDRAYRKDFGWTEKEQIPLKPGSIAHIDDIHMRNICGYGGDEPWSCMHPAVDAPGEEESCQRDCPIASEIYEREALEKIGLADQYEYDEDGCTEEDTGWMEFYGRPHHAMPGNMVLGFTAENQEMFEKRMQIFRALRWITGPYVKLFCSLEPLLGPINFTIPYWREQVEAHFNSLSAHDFSDGSGPLHVPYLNLVILGGETGPGARPMHPDWVRSVRDQCQAAGVPFYFKSWGEWGLGSFYKKQSHVVFQDGQWTEFTHERMKKIASIHGDDYVGKGSTVCRVGSKRAGRLLDGREWNELPWRME